MAKVEDCPGFETFGEDVRAAREALGYYFFEKKNEITRYRQIILVFHSFHI